VANYNDIKAILQAAVGGNLSSDELDKLTSAIVATSGGAAGAAAASVQTIKQQRDLAAVLGRVSEMRKLDVQLAEKQYEQRKAEIAQIVAQGGAVDGKLVKALQSAEAHYLKLKNAQDQAGKSGQVLAGILENTSASLLNLGKTGLTSVGVFMDMRDAFKELTGVQGDYKTGAQEAADAATKEHEAAKKRVESLEKEAKKTGDAIGKQAELAEAKAEAKEASEKLKEAQKALGEETKKTAASAGQMGLAFQKFAQSDLFKGAVQQFDPINVAFSRVQQVFEQAKNIQNESLEIFRETGLVVGDAASGFGRYREQLTEIALKSESLSVESAELNSALVSLQASFSTFDPAGKETMGLIKTFAVMEQAGISSQQSAETFAFFRQALGKTDDEAEQLTLNMMSLADELKRPPSEIAQAFQQGSKSLAAYGRDFVKVQEKMIRVASKLGIEVDGLIGAFDAMDTIEGAAETAGKINAILGAGIGEGLQSIALSNAEVPDKIKMVRETILKMDPTGAMLNNRKIVKALSESIPGMDPAMLQKLLQKGVDIDAELLKTTKQADKEALEARVASQLTAEQKAKLETERLTAGQGMASGLVDTIAENTNLITGVLAAGSAVMQGFQIATVLKGGKGAAGGGLGSALVKGAIEGGADEGGGGILGGAGGLMGDCVRICNDSMVDMGRTFNGGGRTAVGAIDEMADQAGDIGEEVVNVTGDLATSTDKGFSLLGSRFNAMAGRASGGFLSQTLGAGNRIGGLGGALAVAGAGAVGVAIGSAIYESFNKEKATSLSGLRSSDFSFTGAEDPALARGAGDNSAFKQASIKATGVDWATKSTQERYNYCANNNQIAPPNQGGPNCGVVNAKYHREKGTLQKNDFTVSDFKRKVNANMSDEIIGVKEGGLIAKKLDRLISLMAQSGGKEIVIKLDRKEVARSVISTVNNDFYNVGV